MQQMYCILYTSLLAQHLNFYGAMHSLNSIWQSIPETASGFCTSILTGYWRFNYMKIYELKCNVTHTELNQ